ncbi:hypothetical protein [Actinophytocola xanthii]|uniref:Uncharacterized protein n=1 Tax=Actinophytocola xanthii TaxID=1912961 RepID=A0A1Q8BYB3_9PSEU|nr:hypothetical protein [Actinophytocola xanthii]OLF07077.1 hypothetical protein BU204_35795 [Actinophytocola xanthii]
MAADQIFVLRDVYDLAHASDGRSRYGAYLAHNTGRFRDIDDIPSSDPAAFAAAAFAIASRPIMSPPYVSTHPRVVFAAPSWDQDRPPGLSIDLATPMSASIADQLPTGTAGWEHDPRTGQYHPPDGDSRLAAYTRLTVRLPLPVELLPPPSYTATGIAEVETAKRAVRTISAHANSVLAHLIVALNRYDGDDNDSRCWPGCSGHR